MASLLSVLLIHCKSNETNNQEATETTAAEMLERELYMPEFHFTPKANWMNDPNGMFYLDGIYNLYFQYYLDGNVWGPMHWGHATSKDLISWEEQPIALYPDSLGYIFSGGAVVDRNNTSGFSEHDQVPIVATFTYHNMDGEKRGDLDFQTQAIAYSLDKGQTFTKYDGNPVIPNPGIKDFRDPKVTWDEERQQWVMVLAAGDRIMFYSSVNLKDWTLESEFGADLGAHGGVWECPDLIPFQVENSDEQKWVLLVSINPGGPNGGSATQYFVGDFDGKIFTLDPGFLKQLKETGAVWLDYGRDNYAGVTWSNIPESDGRKLFIGWMSNWDYARDVPTETWRSSMTIPRSLHLIKDGEQYHVHSNPVTEISKYISETKQFDSLEISGSQKIIRPDDKAFPSVRIQLEIPDLEEAQYSFVFYNKTGDSLSLGLDNANKQFFLDRRKCGNLDFSDKFAPGRSVVALDRELDSLQATIILDKTSVEVFYNDGRTVMTEIFFPENRLDSFAIESSAQDCVVQNLQIDILKFNKTP